MERGNGKSGQGNENWRDFEYPLDEPVEEKTPTPQIPEGRMMTRRERMRSMKEAETLRALETLDTAGLFIRMEDRELYHGRYRNGWEAEGSWEVDPEFNNAGNATGNRNVNRVPGLNTSDGSTAGRFAQARANAENQRLQRTGELNGATRAIPERPRIVCEDPDAQIIDTNFKMPREVDERMEIYGALEALSRGIIDKIVVGDDSEFPDGRGNKDVMRWRRERARRVRDMMGSYATNLVYDQRQIHQMGEERGYQMDGYGYFVDEGFDDFLEVVKATNTAALMRTNPGAMMLAYMNGNGNVIDIMDEGRMKRVPFSGDFLREWMRQAHVIGMKVDVQSATLRRAMMDRGMSREEAATNAEISNFVLLDRREVRTDERAKERREEIEREYGATARALGEIFQEDEKRGGKHMRRTPANPEVKRELMDVYGDNAELVRAATYNGDYGDNFRWDAGNWEGYSLGEHTETVLNYFDDVYADRVPSEIIPVMKLAILVHDLGKPEAKAWAEEQSRRTGRKVKAEQKPWNEARAREFMESIGVTQEMNKLVVGMIGTGQELTSKAYVPRSRRNLSAEQVRRYERALREHCRGMMDEYLRPSGRKATEAEVEGMERMCVILQTCDSGAYTSRATTRIEGGARMRNAGAFNSSFDAEGKLKTAGV